MVREGPAQRLPEDYNADNARGSVLRRHRQRLVFIGGLIGAVSGRRFSLSWRARSRSGMPIVRLARRARRRSTSSRYRSSLAARHSVFMHVFTARRDTRALCHDSGFTRGRCGIELRFQFGFGSCPLRATLGVPGEGHRGVRCPTK
jgi:hypothetical protein